MSKYILVDREMLYKAIDILLDADSKTIVEMEKITNDKNMTNETTTKYRAMREIHKNYSNSLYLLMNCIVDKKQYSSIEQIIKEGKLFVRSLPFPEFKKLFNQLKEDGYRPQLDDSGNYVLINRKDDE